MDMARLPRVEPYGGEAIRFGVEPGDSGAGGFCSVRIEEGEIRLEKLAVLDHVLLARAFLRDRVPVAREECLDDVPVARKLGEQLLTGAGAFGGSYWLCVCCATAAVAMSKVAIIHFLMAR
jgi:hypothetical protein